jgi:hypothetical protein
MYTQLPETGAMPPRPILAPSGSWLCLGRTPPSCYSDKPYAHVTAQVSTLPLLCVLRSDLSSLPPASQFPGPLCSLSMALAFVEGHTF